LPPLVHLIHGVDSFNLLKEINKQALKNGRVIDCLLQVHIAKEETKFGFGEHELHELGSLPRPGGELHELKNIKIIGLMGMASFSDDKDLIRAEFQELKKIFDTNTQFSTLPPGPAGNNQFSTLSMGMSSDYKIALEEGSTMVRIGSLLFGERNYIH